MFSLGPIKTATALGGGLIRVSDHELLSTMKMLQQNYSASKTTSYLKRVAKYAAMKAFCNRHLMAAIDWISRMTRQDLDTMLVNVARGYRQDDLLAQIRRRPHPALLATMNRRLREDHSKRIKRRAAIGRRLAKQIDATVSIDSNDSFWIFPVVAKDSISPDQIVSELRRAGFDVTMQCRLSTISAPGSQEEATPS